MTPEKHLGLVELVAKAIATGQGYTLSTLFPGPRLNVEHDARSAVDALYPQLVASEPDRNWDVAVDWLLNSGYVDSDLQDAFWMLSHGYCTEAEAEVGTLADGTTMRQARAARSER